MFACFFCMLEKTEISLVSTGPPSPMRANVYLPHFGIIVECVVLKRASSEDFFPHVKVVHPPRTNGERSPASVKWSMQKAQDEDVNNRSMSTRATLPPVTLIPEEGSLVVHGVGPHGLAESMISSSPIFTPRSGVSNTPRSAISLPSGHNMEQQRAMPHAPARYVVRTALHPHRDTIVDYRDIIPFGYHAPSAVFGLPGRHLNLGIAMMVLDDGSVILEKYPRKSVHAGILEQDLLSPLHHLILPPPAHLLSKLGEQQEAIRKAKAESEGGALAAMVSAIQAAKRGHNVRTCTMPEVQLLPMLSGARPTGPLRVGSAVKVRRSGHSGRLYHGVIVRASYDCSYSVRFDSDRAVEHNILHNDVLLVSDVEAEDVAVRDRVRFVLGDELDDSRPILRGRGIVVASFGSQRYHVHGTVDVDADRRSPAETSRDDENSSSSGVSSSAEDVDDEDRDDHHREGPQNSSRRNRSHTGKFTVFRKSITHIAPKFFDASASVYGDVLLPIFCALGAEESGTLPWTTVMNYFSQPDYGGQPLTPEEWGRIHHEIFGVRAAATTDLRSADDVQPMDVTVAYAEFEYVATRILKLKW